MNARIGSEASSNPIENITILGATGSIGQACLSVIASNSNLKAHSLVANRDLQTMCELIEKFQPKSVLLCDEKANQELKKMRFKHQVKFASTLDEILSDGNSKTVMAAISTSDGLSSVLAALKQQKIVLLANKESLVMAGKLMIDTAKKNQTQLIPVDSEHNAILQSLPSSFKLHQSDLVKDFGVDKITLTASGGSVWHLDDVNQVDLKQALIHPNWSMGKKITVDSNTMANKGLEMIEASYLFELNHDQMDCLIHPQSIVHGLVHFQDASVIAALANPDMRVSISYAISYAIHSHAHPNQASAHINKAKPLSRIQNHSQRLDLTNQSLEFHAVDLKKYPCFELAQTCLKKKRQLPLVFQCG